MANEQLNFLYLFYNSNIMIYKRAGKWDWLPVLQSITSRCWCHLWWSTLSSEALFTLAFRQCMCETFGHWATAKSETSRLTTNNDTELRGDEREKKNKNNKNCRWFWHAAIYYYEDLERNISVCTVRDLNLSICGHSSAPSLANIT